MKKIDLHISDFRASSFFIDSNLTKIFVTLGIINYTFQAAFFGPLRYLLSQAHLQSLWYIPDLFGIGAGAILLLRSTPAYLLLFGAILYSSIVGLIVSDSSAAVFSALKALFPIFLGFLFEPRILKGRIVRQILLLAIVVAVAGVEWSRLYPLPWNDLSFEGVGATQTFKEAQWMIGGEVRSFGFGGDQHSSASAILFIYVMLSFGSEGLALATLAVIAGGGIWLTTSRTLLLCFLVYNLVFLGYRFFGWGRLVRFCLTISLLFFLVPLIVMLVASYFNESEVPPVVLSLWIRGSHTWLEPFIKTASLFPLGDYVGFGLGGVGFALLQSDMPDMFTTVDNFIILNYLIFGPPYAIFYIHQSVALLRERDVHRIAAFVAISIYGLTLRGWSDSPFMILFGYSIAHAFRSRRASAVNGRLIGSSAVPWRSV